MTDTQKIWEANSVRVVLFPAESAALSPDIWRPLLTTEPEIEETRSREGVRRQAGTFRQGSQLEIVSSPIRIDIALSPQAPAQAASPVPDLVVTIGEFAANLEALANPLRKWLPNCSIPVQRIAVSGSALMDADTMIGSYDLLSRYVKNLAIDPNNMRDLNYRVNWPVKSNIDDITHYNRITTFSALLFNMQAKVNFGSPSVSLISKFFACLEIDINTPAEQSKPLAAGRLVPMLNDLIGLAIENLERGECPTVT